MKTHIQDPNNPKYTLCGLQHQPQRAAEPTAEASCRACQRIRILDRRCTDNEMHTAVRMKTELVNLKTQLVPAATDAYRELLLHPNAGYAAGVFRAFEEAMAQIDSALEGATKEIAEAAKRAGVTDVDFIMDTVARQPTSVVVATPPELFCKRHGGTYEGAYVCSKCVEQMNEAATIPSVGIRDDQCCDMEAYQS